MGHWALQGGPQQLVQHRRRRAAGRPHACACDQIRSLGELCWAGRALSWRVGCSADARRSQLSKPPLGAPKMGRCWGDVRTQMRRRILPRDTEQRRGSRQVHKLKETAFAPGGESRGPAWERSRRQSIWLARNSASHLPTQTGVASCTRRGENANATSRTHGGSPHRWPGSIRGFTPSGHRAGKSREHTQIARKLPGRPRL